MVLAHHNVEATQPGLHEDGVRRQGPVASTPSARTRVIAGAALVERLAAAAVASVGCCWHSPCRPRRPTPLPRRRPRNVHVTGTTATSATLAWTASSDDVGVDHSGTAIPPASLTVGEERTVTNASTPASSAKGADHQPAAASRCAYPSANP